MRRLSRSGFKGEFVRSAILPEWWADECAEDPEILPDIELRVARFLELPLSAVTDPCTALALPKYPAAHLRRVRDVDQDRLAPAIHAALRIGGAVARNLRDPTPTTIALPTDGLAWRQQIQRSREALALEDILSYLWLGGIPVVPVDLLPAPSFQGLACVVEGRPVILLGHKHDAPGRVAFLVAHEVGHIAAGDCAPDRPVVDEEDEIFDDVEMERMADRYATRALVGGDAVPPVAATEFKQLASNAAELERDTGADASVITFVWAAHTGDYSMASMAVRALYRATGARRQLQQQFDHHVDLDSAPESDRALLRCVRADPESDETGG
jgi:hypothetical protein